MKLAVSEEGTLGRTEQLAAVSKSSPQAEA